MGSYLTMAEYRARWGVPFETTQVLYKMFGVSHGSTSTTVRVRRCNGPPAVFVDGWYMGAESVADINSLVPSDWLEAVEAHQNPRFVNVGRGAVDGCGAVYLWTKPLDNQFAEDIPVEPGARVRVTAPATGLSRYVGEYVAGDRDTVYVRGGARDTPLAIPLTSVTLLELRTGEKRPRLLGTGVGFAVGAVVGALTGVPNEDQVLSALVLAVPGSFIGFLVGSVLKTDRWEDTVADGPQTLPAEHADHSRVP